MMKKNTLHVFVSIVLTIYSYNVYSQPLKYNLENDADSLQPIIKDIKGNTVFLGILHTKIVGDKDHLKNFPISKTSGKIFCSIYPELIEASKGKQIVLLMEGVNAYSTIMLDSALIEEFELPKCLLSVSDLAVGCDTRPNLLKIRSLSVFYTIDTLYDDGLDGAETSFEEAYNKPNELDLSRLNPQSVLFVYDWGKSAGIYNESFESSILTISQKLEQEGYFVLVVCGAAHVAKMLMQKKINESGYVFCVEPDEILPVIKTAKFLSAIEHFAHTK